MNSPNILDNANILVLGLGSHGGGVSVVKHCVECGARVTVYDRQTADALSASIDTLSQFHRTINFSLGHQDYTLLGNYDIVIKNPAIPRTHPLLSHAPICLTDISLFLAETTQKIIAVTGTKGKSTTVSAIAYGLQSLKIPHVLVGNIGIAALDKLPSLKQSQIIILEISSFQLGDYAYCTKKLRQLIEQHLNTDGDIQPHRTSLTQTQQRIAQYYYQKLLPKNWPEVAIITNIYPDHLDYYATMDDYIADKMVIFEQQTTSQYKFINAHQSQQQYREQFKAHGGAQSILYQTDASPTITPPSQHADRSPSLHIHETTNTAYFFFNNHTHTFDCSTPLNISHVNAQVAIAQSVILCAAQQHHNLSYTAWHGVPHRLEIIVRHRGIMVINDSAATIPVATLQNVSQLPQPIFLICGGSDKRVDLTPFIDIGTSAEEIFLLSGSATDSMIDIFKHNNLTYHGPFTSMQDAVESAWQCIDAKRNNNLMMSHEQSAGDTDIKHNSPSTKKNARPSQILILSPGCASFGMFRHEFDRGDQFVQCVRKLISANA